MEWTQIPDLSEILLSLGKHPTQGPDMPEGTLPTGTGADHRGPGGLCPQRAHGQGAGPVALSFAGLHLADGAGTGPGGAGGAGTIGKGPAGGLHPYD